MSLDSNDIKQLNSALKGEHMAIENFDHFINDTSDNTLKEKLHNIQKKHEDHASQLAERIQKLGGNPANTSGVIGAIAEIKYKINPKDYIDNSIIKTVIEGEEIGVKSYSNIISRLSDTSNIAFVEDLLNENRGIIDDLSSL